MRRDNEIPFKLEYEDLPWRDQGRYLIRTFRRTLIDRLIYKFIGGQNDGTN